MMRLTAVNVLRVEEEDMHNIALTIWTADEIDHMRTYVQQGKDGIPSRNERSRYFRATRVRPRLYAEQHLAGGLVQAGLTFIRLQGAMEIEIARYGCWLRRSGRMRMSSG